MKFLVESKKGGGIMTKKVITISENNNIDQASAKKMLSTTVAFGVLRRELIDNLGVKRVKGFLLRYGSKLGESDAKEAMKVDTSIEFLIKQASLMHLSTGQVSDIQSERHIETENGESIKFIEGKGRWIDSYEAQEHIKHHGFSDSPVCHTLTGYANGYMSTISNRKMVVVETSCVGKGDKECIFETKLVENWGPEIQEELKYYEEKRIVDELEYTFEQLLEERNYVNTIANFHKQLTENVSNGSNLEDIAESVYRTLEIPVTIEALGFHSIARAGIDEQENEKLDTELKEILLKKNQKVDVLPSITETTKLEMPNHTRLIAPIFVQKKIVGYCTFIYLESINQNQDYDIQFLERMANATSLILLNEKTSFEALEKMKGNLLEQLLMGEYNSKEEMINRGRYMNLDFEEPFYIATIEHKENEQQNMHATNQTDQIIEVISKYLDIQGINILTGKYENHVVLYIPAGKMEKKQMYIVLDKILKHIKDAFAAYKYKIGISNKSTDIGSVLESMEKARIALRMSNKKEISDYDDLGILGVLINAKNIEIIKEMADKELGPLFSADQKKSNDLIKTLYVFLSNGGNLQQTMDDLALSMSGLTYRKNKIEKLIDKDLRNPTQSYHLLLILDSLIALEELEIT